MARYGLRGRSIAPGMAKARSPSSPHQHVARSNIRETSISMSPPSRGMCLSNSSSSGRVTTRFEKTARNYRAVVTFGAIVLWMR